MVDCLAGEGSLRFDPGRGGLEKSSLMNFARIMRKIFLCLVSRWRPNDRTRPSFYESSFDRRFHADELDRSMQVAYFSLGQVAARLHFNMRNEAESEQL